MKFTVKAYSSGTGARLYISDFLKKVTGLKEGKNILYTKIVFVVTNGKMYKGLLLTTEPISEIDQAIIYLTPVNLDNELSNKLSLANILSSAKEDDKK